MGFFPVRVARRGRDSVGLSLLACLSILVVADPSDAADKISEISCYSDRLGSSQAEELGLTSTSNAAERLGVFMSVDDARRIDEMESARDRVDMVSIRRSASEIYGENLVSITWSYINGLEIGLSSVAPEARLDGLDPSVPTKVILVGDALSESERTRRTMMFTDPKVLELFDKAGVVGGGADEWCGRMVFHVLAAESIETARDVLATQIPLDYSEFLVVGNEGREVPLLGRTTYESSQSGGLSYTVQDGDMLSCTSAAPWYWTNGSNAVRYAVTAGHCVNQATWGTQPSNWNQVWWTQTSSPADLKHATSTVSTSTAQIRMGGELDVAIWPIGQNGNARTAINGINFAYSWKSLGWWQWDPNWVTGSSGGDAIGDYVCQSGVTTAAGSSASVVTSCGSIIDRAHFGGYENSWHYLRREATTNACSGDSGGTVWRTSWYAGIAASGRYPLGNGCYDNMTYSHVGYMQQMGLTAPVGFN